MKTLRFFFDYWIDPDLYMDVRDLPDPFELQTPIAITNNETIDLYYRVELINPPVGYSEYVDDVGVIGAGASTFKVFTFKRVQPTLVDGELSEDLLIRISAFTDSAYTDLYAQAEFPFTIHYYDHGDPAWTELYHDNFDDGTAQGWEAPIGSIDPAIGVWGGNTVESVHYITPPYGLNASTTSGRYAKKDYTVGAYTRAYVTLHFYLRSYQEVAIKIGDQLVKPGVVPAPWDRWTRFCYPLPVNATTTVALQCSYGGYLWIDEIIVIAR